MATVAVNVVIVIVLQVRVVVAAGGSAGTTIACRYKAANAVHSARNSLEIVAASAVRSVVQRQVRMRRRQHAVL